MEMHLNITKPFTNQLQFTTLIGQMGYLIRQTNTEIQFDKIKNS